MKKKKQPSKDGPMVRGATFIPVAQLSEMITPSGGGPLANPHLHGDILGVSVQVRSDHLVSSTDNAENVSASTMFVVFLFMSL